MPMKINVSKIEIEGPLIIKPDFFQDERGFFFESYSYQQFSEHGIEINFVQDNHSRSSKGLSGSTVAARTLYRWQDMGRNCRSSSFISDFWQMVRN
jgi:hypothetical protein